jgi:hypothetical protein
MRTFENEDTTRHHALKRPSLDPRARKIREGKVGGFRNHLGDRDIAYLERRIEQIGDPFAEYYRSE